MSSAATPRDPLRYFRIEARDLVDRLSNETLRLEREALPADSVQALLRAAHTLKGAARVVRQVEISDLAHRIEDVLQPQRDATATVDRTTIDLLLQLVDAIAARLAALPPVGGSAADEAGWAPAFARSDEGDLEALLAGLGEIGHQLTALRSSVAATGAEHALAAPVERIVRELGATRDAAERLRLAPAGTLFAALERAARDAARSAGKEVLFSARGGELRLEPAVLDGVQPALVQLVRNSVAHGIEPESDRRAAGKPAAGRISIEVVRDGHRARFICRDDGRGLDLEGIRQALRRSGVDPVQVAMLDRDALVTRLMQGGISTTAAVNDLSGRGVGLDVVRDAARRLKGEVTARPVPGGGTAFELGVPVSRASLDVLVVEAGGQVAAIPLAAVRGTLRIQPADIVRSAERDAVSHLGQLIRLVPLVLDAGWRGTGRRVGAAISAVIVAAAGSSAALAVDRVRGIENVVLRPLPPAAVAAAIVLGTHLDAEGNPRLVLDPAELATGALADRLELPVVPRRDPILIVDDSLTTRMLEASILQSAGFAVEMATSGEEALQKIRDRRFSLFLVDVEMPGIDGFELIERLRADPVARDTPVVLVTSRASADDRRRGAEAGASAHIVKSEFDQSSFLDRVTSLVRK